MNAKSSLAERLAEHPELQARIESLLDVAEAKAGQPILADDVEDFLCEQMKEIARETMKEWAREREKQAAEEARREGWQRNKGKKN